MANVWKEIGKYTGLARLLALFLKPKAAAVVNKTADVVDTAAAAGEQVEEEIKK